MKRINRILYIIVLYTVCIPLHAQNTLPAPYAEVKGKVMISQFQTLEKPATEEGIFLNALLWLIENREVTTEGDREIPIDVNYDKHQYTVPMQVSNPQTNSRYRYLLSVKISEKIITLLVSDIIHETDAPVIKLIKRTPFEKLQPEKKPKHKEYLSEFESHFNQFFSQMQENIAAQNPPVITHWKEIRNNEVVKGMNHAECLLSKGKPIAIQTQGDKEKWMYDSYTYLFFENGKVSTIIK